MPMQLCQTAMLLAASLALQEHSSRKNTFINAHLEKEAVIENGQATLTNATEVIIALFCHM